MNAKPHELLQIDRQIAALMSGYMGLRRLVLELHSRTTGEPMNQTEQRLRGYIDAELNRLLKELADTGAIDFAKALDFRNQPPPSP